MRGDDRQQAAMWSHISPEQRVPPDHPLRPIRAMVDGVLRELSPRFEALYAKRGRPSIAPEKRLRALVLQLLYSVRSERLLMEQLDYNLLFRWFVGLNMDDPIWDATVFTKNRQRLLDGDRSLNAARKPDSPSGDVRSRPIRCTFRGCCAWVASGAARRPRPRAVRKARQSITRSPDPPAAGAMAGSSGRGPSRP